MLRPFLFLPKSGLPRSTGRCRRSASRRRTPPSRRRTKLVRKCEAKSSKPENVFLINLKLRSKAERTSKKYVREKKWIAVILAQLSYPYPAGSFRLIRRYSKNNFSNLSSSPLSNDFLNYPIVLIDRYWQLIDISNFKLTDTYHQLIIPFDRLTFQLIDTSINRRFKLIDVGNWSTFTSFPISSPSSCAVARIPASIVLAPPLPAT